MNDNSHNVCLSNTRRNIWLTVSVFVFVFAAAGCSKVDAPSSTTFQATPTVSTTTENRIVSYGNPEDLPGVEWPNVSMPPGQAWIKCEFNDKPPTPFTEMSAQALLHIMMDCWKVKEVTYLELTYKGEIGKGFTDLIARMNEIARRFKVTNIRMSIDSGGGDVVEAINAGNLMAKANWTVLVENDANCYSACVLVLAAANTRVIGGQIGIHRIIQENSSANSRDELNDELIGIHDQVSIYLVKNGVAKTVSDLMMTIPAGDIRILTRKELKDFGLWWTNAAQADLARIEMIQRCGKDYVTRRDMYIQSRKQCQNGERTEAGLAAYSECMNALAEKLGLPDSKCPESPSSIILERGPE